MLITWRCLNCKHLWWGTMRIVQFTSDNNQLVISMIEIHGVFTRWILYVTTLFPSLVQLSCGKLTYVHGVSQNIPNPPCFPYMCTVALHSHSHAYLEWQPIILAVRWQNWIMILNPALKALFFFCKVIFVPNHSEWFHDYLKRNNKLSYSCWILQ